MKAMDKFVFTASPQLNTVQNATNNTPTPNNTPAPINTPAPNNTPSPNNTLTASQHTTPNPTVNTNPNLTPNTTHTELKSPKKEDDDEPLASKKKPTRTSDVWDHFTKIKVGNPKHPRCTCNYCGSDYACHSRRVGTSSLWVHLEKCKKNPDRLCDKKQKVLSFAVGNKAGGNLLAYTFNRVRCRNALARFVVKDEQAFNVVEGNGFKELIQELQPQFVVPSRMTVTRDVYHLFCNERMKLMKELTKAGQRMCLTSDCWTSCTQMSYMCLTAHYIDSEWNLQKRIINFCQVPKHKGETICKVIEACLLSWEIEKVFSVTLDNASANDGAVNFVKRRVNGWKGSVLDGEYIHVRCGAHIVNLIVTDGLKNMYDSIAAIRNSVRYIRSSPARLQKFMSCVERERIDYKGGLVLDVSTRWNSTYMMLDVALKFEKAFTRYEEEDDKFLGYFMEKENGKKRIGPPTTTDWESAAVFVKFLATFYEVTLKLSGTLHVTSNNFYHEICEIHTQLTDLAVSGDPLLCTMAASMIEKYDKYWGNADNINPLLFLAVVLDPRYKMRYLKFCFDTFYDAETVAKLVVKVESVLQRLYSCYDVEGEGESSKTAKNDSQPKNDGKEIRRKLLESFLQQQMPGTEKRNELETYLAEEPVNPMISSFDILTWWKTNSSKYKILSMMARDVLAIPVSTVASESAFSTSGRILDSFRSSLSPKMVETLICTQSWLKGNQGCINSREYLDEIQTYEFLEEDNMNKAKNKDTSSNEKIVNVDE